MTGEITLTGQVLPIGGIREKSLAAQRAGLKRVILPRENESDLAELPPETRAAIEFIPADTVEDVFAAAFDGKRHRGARRGLGTSDRQAASRAERSRRSRTEVSAKLETRPAQASVRGRGRASPAEQLVLDLLVEHECDLLRRPGPVVDRVVARLPAGDLHRPLVDDPATLLLGDAAGDPVELA